MSCIVRTKLAGLLLTVAEEELKIEQTRQSLAASPAFEPYAAFSRLDRQNKGYLTGVEIKDFLRDNEICHLLDIECNYLVKFFDSDPFGHPQAQLDF